jgi:hypothetical protein
MKKFYGVLALVTCCFVLLAANKGESTRSAPGVYDADGRFVGTLVDYQSGYSVVFVPSLGKMIQFDRDGGVAPEGFYFTSTDCTGTPYIFEAGPLDPFLIRRYGSELVTITKTGSSSPPSFNSYYDIEKNCHVVAGLYSTGAIPVSVTPLGESLPFTVPLAQPLTLR